MFFAVFDLEAVFLFAWCVAARGGRRQRAPVTAFVATTSTTAIVALLLRYFYFSGALEYRAVFLAFSVIAIASMCAGNLLALQQRNVKRILAYSSIAHFGYILVAVLAGRTKGIQAVSFYLAAYTVTLLVAFGSVTVVSGRERDGDDLEDYRGLFWRRPVIACGKNLKRIEKAWFPVS